MNRHRHPVLSLPSAHPEAAVSRAVSSRNVQNRAWWVRRSKVGGLIEAPGQARVSSEPFVPRVGRWGWGGEEVEVAAARSHGVCRWVSALCPFFGRGVRGPNHDGDLGRRPGHYNYCVESSLWASGPGGAGGTY